MPKRFAAILFGALVVIVAGSTAAFASDPYPPVVSGLEVSNSRPAPGGSLTVSGNCQAPDVPVTITIVPPGTVLAHATTGPDGQFSTTVTIPGNASGNATLVASNANGTCVLSAAITVASAATLAFTGSNSTSTFVPIGILLAAIGSVLIVASARRHRVSRRV
jgi:hypothetical protein